MVSFNRLGTDNDYSQIAALNLLLQRDAQVPSVYKTAKHKFRNDFSQHENHGLTIGMQIGGTNTRIMVADAQEKIGLKDYDPNILELSNQDSKSDLETLQKIIELVSVNAKGTVEIVMSVAGFPTKTGIQVAGTELKQDEAGLLYLPNKDFSNVDYAGVTGRELYKEANVHPQAKGKVPYLNLLKLINSSKIESSTEIEYHDESSPNPIIVARRANPSSDKNRIVIIVQNDTVTAGESAAAIYAQSTHKNAFNSKGIVGGTGFNDSSNINFDQLSNKSELSYNNESGSAAISKDDPILLQFDKTKEDLRGDIVFAGGSDSAKDDLKGIRRMLQNITKYIKGDESDQMSYAYIETQLNNELKEHSIDFQINYADSGRSLKDDLNELNKGSIATNREIQNLAADSTNQLAKAAVLLKANQMARYFVSRDLKNTKTGEDYLNNLSVLGVTGSYLVSIVNNVKGAKEAFLQPFKTYNPNIQLITHEIGGVDGMHDLINTKAALARSIS